MTDKKNKTSDAQLRANAKYQSTSTRQFGFKFVLATDSDIIEKLESVENKQKYVKGLIRSDIAGITLGTIISLMDNDISITIHQDGEVDSNYLYVSDIEEDLFDRTVTKIETGIPKKTDIRISIK